MTTDIREKAVKAMKEWDRTADEITYVAGYTHGYLAGYEAAKAEENEKGIALMEHLYGLDREAWPHG